MGDTFKDASRKNWASNDTVEHINTGSLQRIADATEKMAQRHTELIAQRDYYEAQWKRQCECRAHAERSNVSLRGHITKLRKKLAAAEIGKSMEKEA